MFENYKLHNPTWRLLVEKREMGIDALNKALSSRVRNYWQGYIDSIGEIMEQIEKDIKSEDILWLKVGSLLLINNKAYIVNNKEIKCQ